MTHTVKCRLYQPRLNPRRTKLEMLIYTLILFPLSLMPAFTGIAGTFYLVGASILSGLFTDSESTSR